MKSHKERQAERARLRELHDAGKPPYDATAEYEKSLAEGKPKDEKQEHPQAGAWDK